MKTPPRPKPGGPITLTLGMQGERPLPADYGPAGERFKDRRLCRSQSTGSSCREIGRCLLGSTMADAAIPSSNWPSRRSGWPAFAMRDGRSFPIEGMTALIEAVREGETRELYGVQEASVI